MKIIYFLFLFSLFFGQNRENISLDLSNVANESVYLEAYDDSFNTMLSIHEFPELRKNILYQVDL